MEEDDEIQSAPSSESGSPASPMSNGRITVTVAALPPPPSSQNTVNWALPNQQPKGGGGGGGGREDCWSEDATAVLIDAWGERYLELSRGNLKQKHWKEVADIVSSRDDYTKTPRTDVQCKNRIDTVKKKYKLEKSKIIANGGVSQWSFFEKMEHLIGPTAKAPGSTGVLAASVASPLQSDKVPMGIPVGTRQVKQLRAHHSLQQKKESKTQNLHFRKRGRGRSESSGSEKGASPPSMDSFPPEIHERKRVVGMQKETKQKVNQNSAALESVSKGKNGPREKDSNAVRELTQAILKFGETYEQAESAKLQQIVELEKQRMKFTTELELQRMRFFLKTQLEISELRQGKKV